MTNETSLPIAGEFRSAVDALPPALRALLNAELAAGNRIVSAGHHHPAPPVGAFVMLEQPVSTQPRRSTHDISFYDRNSSSYRGEFADSQRFFFVLEAPGPEPEPPDMDAIREAANPAPLIDPSTPPSMPDAWTRFQKSREIDYAMWREGVGYDLEALADVSSTERAAIVASLVPPSDWRDVEALVAIGSPSALEALGMAAREGDISVRLAIASRAPQLVPDAVRTDMLLQALASADIMGGLSEALDQMEEFHPPPVIDALFAALMEREGAVAYHCAATLAVIHGVIASRMDWSMRPLFLQFNTDDLKARRAALLELRQRLGLG
jgi:hypothetical protein